MVEENRKKKEVVERETFNSIPQSLLGINITNIFWLKKLSLCEHESLTNGRQKGQQSWFIPIVLFLHYAGEF